MRHIHFCFDRKHIICSRFTPIQTIDGFILLKSMANKSKTGKTISDEPMTITASAKLVSLNQAHNLLRHRVSKKNHIGFNIPRQLVHSGTLKSLISTSISASPSGRGELDTLQPSIFVLQPILNLILGISIPQSIHLT